MFKFIEYEPKKTKNVYLLFLFTNNGSNDYSTQALNSSILLSSPPALETTYTASVMCLSKFCLPEITGAVSLSLFRTAGITSSVLSSGQPHFRATLKITPFQINARLWHQTSDARSSDCLHIVYGSTPMNQGYKQCAHFFRPTCI